MRYPIRSVEKLGQSIWYDNIRRGLITSGELRRMVLVDGVLGVTSNPAIFEKALSGSADYDESLRALISEGVTDPEVLFERLAIEDIQLAADVLHASYVDSRREDGFVSIEVSPRLANDTQATIDEALRLHAAVNRENVMIKIPGTTAGIPAIEALIAAGIPINVTLLFSVDRYIEVSGAYLRGLERRSARGRDVQRVASVASIFVSRIDTAIDTRVEHLLDQTRDPQRRRALKSLVGRVAIDNARLAYSNYKKLCGSERWQALARLGARPQRLLWASTGTKNPKYPKTHYVQNLLAPGTVNTLPTETFLAMRDVTHIGPAFTDDWEENGERVNETFRTLAAVGISLEEVTNELLEAGVKSFEDAYERLLKTLDEKREGIAKRADAGAIEQLGAEKDEVELERKRWHEDSRVERLWQGDASLWTQGEEANWLGWLHVVDGSEERAEELARVSLEFKDRGLDHVVVLGMGGSSLCPEVLSRCFPAQTGFPRLLTLDSTVPSQVQAVRGLVNPARTMFIVSSKSGTTIEANVLKDHFFAEVQKAVGPESAGSHFVAITDPGTPLHQLAKANGFCRIAHGRTDIGGRFSALSNFGLVPAAVAGIDLRDFLSRAESMAQACSSSVPVGENPGVQLGTVIGTLARQGRNKLTFIVSPKIEALGLWLEQLLAESTGKCDRGVVPIAGEWIGPPNVYGDDRFFVYLRLGSDPDPRQDETADALASAGQPVMRIEIEGPTDLGREFFRWEFATAVAGSILDVNPFDQPDVESAKRVARRLIAAHEESGSWPHRVPVLEAEGLQVFASDAYAERLGLASGAIGLSDVLARHLGQLEAGDYFAFQAFLAMDDLTDRELRLMRHEVRDYARVATTVGYGPRYLHSTGQLHKGGPNRGLFLQITAEDAEELPIPGRRFGFGALAAAQAEGDFDVLEERGRRILRVHLGPDRENGLALLRERMLDAVLS